MSRFNTFRIINLSYNNNAMKIDDETFNLNGDSTLMSLRNGGGKSVLVQMMMAPFVHKRYRDTKDREFSSYFTSNTPTSILVEWVLDGGAGYVLTGMIVRKKAVVSDEDSKDNLEIINFIYEYNNKNKYDIHNIPLVENTEGGKKIKNLNNIKTLFESLKKDRSMEFNYYDMNSSNHSKSYFDKLKEYKINSKEWESIIKKVNLKESGLSELFTDAKDVTGLVDKWFLKTVEDKLDKEGNRVRKFSEIVLKYIKQYKDNKSKIDKKQAINEFKTASEGILENAHKFEDTINNTKKIENKIANLYKLLNRNLEEREIRENELEDNLEKLKEDIKEIKYESLSLEIYNLQDERDEFIILLESIEEEINTRLNKKNELEKDKNIQACSKIHSDYMELSKEVQKYENQLDIIKQKDMDLGPERNNLGYTLCKYYKSRNEKEKNKLNGLESEIKKLRENHESETMIINSIHKESQKLNNSIGILEGTIKSYNKIEENFNKNHNESLIRNIIGYYDETLIEEKTRAYNLELEGLEKEIKDLSILKNNKTEESKSKAREQENLSKKLQENKGNLAREEENLNAYEISIEERKNIIRYIGLDESKLFNTEEILLSFEKRINILKGEERNYQISLDKEEEEYSKLKTGKILELPKDFVARFEKLDINPVYGMEWLKRNNKSQKDNLELVEKNPFIPYSIILGASDLEKLDKEVLDIFTSYPIPIIKREDLELAREKQTSRIYSLENMSFLIAFNNKLIDENGLKALIENKEIKINGIKEKIDLKNDDIKLYEGKRNFIRYDKLEKELYEKCKLEIENMLESVRILDEKVNSLRLEIQEIDKFIEYTQQSIRTKDNNKTDLAYKIKDFKSLSNYYNEYDYNKKSKEKLVDELNKINESIKVKTNELEIIVDRISKCDESRQQTTSEIKSINEKVNKYEIYKQGEIIEKDIEDIEARYESIIKEITDDEKTISERLSLAKSRFNIIETDIALAQEEYSLKDVDFIHVKYDRFIENTIKENIKKEELALNRLSEEKSNEKTEIAVKEQDIKNKKEKLYENNSYESLKPREEIIELNFKARRLAKEHESRDIDKELASLRNQKGKLSTNIAALSEFDNLVVNEELELIIDLENLNRVAGEIKRDYTNSKSEEIKRRRDLDNEIVKALKIEELKEDFFRKPLEILVSISDNPCDVIENLNITIYSYNTLIEKLEADIELIEREKDNVLDILFQYINDVHHNIGKIDRNSTVNIRDRAIKMLKITIPSWEDNEELYRIRLKDMIDRITAIALEVLDKNENIEDLISKEITTRNMYNEVVSISNIDVKLYKIEEEREVLISWGEVSKNSGGEGFLSAFVVLSSLLSFIRRDDTDIFADNESGKVLVMDNPFAQTNAAHLLKPLMDVAKKSNTQLICLSGLGGDSIYNRFDNIYVLNLVSSKLRGGLQYLRGEHKKGEEDVERIVSTNIKIEESEQIHLF